MYIYICVWFISKQFWSIFLEPISTHNKLWICIGNPSDRISIPRTYHFFRVSQFVFKQLFIHHCVCPHKLSFPQIGNAWGAPMMFLYLIQLGASGLSLFQFRWSPNMFMHRHGTWQWSSGVSFWVKISFYTCSSAEVSNTIVIIHVLFFNSSNAKATQRNNLSN